MLLDAMSVIRIREEGIRLLVAGEFYEDSKPYLDQIERLGLSDRVILHTAFIPDSKVKYYLCATDLVVQPYRSATQSGVTPLAYHFDKPMLVTNVGALADMVPHEQVGIVTAPDPAAIAAGILRFYALGEAHFIPYIQQEKRKYTWLRLEETIQSLADAVQK